MTLKFLNGPSSVVRPICQSVGLTPFSDALPLGWQPASGEPDAALCQ